MFFIFEYLSNTLPQIMQFLSFRGPGKIKLMPEKSEKHDVSVYRGHINDFDFSLAGTHIHYLYEYRTNKYEEFTLYMLAWRLSERKRSECRKSAKLVPWLMSMSHKIDFVVIYKKIANILVDIDLPRDANILEQIKPICGEEAIHCLLLAPVTTKMVGSPFSSLMAQEILSKIDNIKVEPCPCTGVTLISIEGICVQFESALDDPRVLKLVRECPAAKEAYDSIFGDDQDGQLIDYD